LLHIAKTDEEHLRHIDNLLASGVTADQRQRASRSMEAESWDSKVEDLSHLVENLGYTPHVPAEGSKPVLADPSAWRDSEEHLAVPARY
jgi:hypothetical protein